MGYEAVRYTWSEHDKSAQRRAALVTVLVQAVLLFVLFYFGFSTPLPLPGEEGIAISFGEPQAGGKGVTLATPTPRPNQAQPQVRRQEAPLTQDFEEAPSIPVPKPKPQPKPKQAAEAPIAPPKSAEPQIDQAALFPGSTQSNGTKQQGSGTGANVGQQGDPTASYTGAGGLGRGQGSKGSGLDAQGISYSLGARGALKLPLPNYPKQKGGKVVVKVWVNRDGRVVRAEAGQPGSTTFDNALLHVAQQAALQASFDTDSNAPEQQVGSITYIFQLKQ